MAGRDRLAQRGAFVQPALARQAVTELEDLASPIGAFLRDRCIVGPGHCVECETLYAAWSTWCTDQHCDHPGSPQTFGRQRRTLRQHSRAITPPASGCATITALAQAGAHVVLGARTEPRSTTLRSRSVMMGVRLRRSRWTSPISMPLDGVQFHLMVSSQIENSRRDAIVAQIGIVTKWCLSLGRRHSVGRRC
jgi:hypothetical protein